MESELPEERPISPKKKFRPNSTSNSEIPIKSDSSTQGDSDSSSDSSTPTVNGCGGLSAPTRSGRILPSLSAGASPQVESSPQTQNNSQSSSSNIQEEVVSSSENTVCSKQSIVGYKEGDADSVTNAEPDVPSLSGEAVERKDL